MKIKEKCVSALFLKIGLFQERKIRLFFCRFVRGRRTVLLIIDFPSVTDRQGKDYQLVVVDLTNQTVISDAVTPLAASIRSQPFSVDTRILAVDKVFLNPRFNHLHISG